MARTRAWLVAGAIIVLMPAIAGCGGGDAGAAAGAGPANAVFNPTAAAAVLTAFDHADSAASSAGDLTALAAQETSPALDASVASVRRAQAANRSQTAFKHVDPVFAIPAGEPTCFLAVATLTTAGAELTRTDVSQFVRGEDGAWKLSHNVQVGASDAVAVRAGGGKAAMPSTIAVDEAQRSKISAEVFSRTTAAAPPDLSVVGTSVLLDQQFAAGWKIYQQQMAAAHMAVSRTLSGADWSSCAVRTDSGAFAFLTMKVTDTIRPAAGGGPTVTMPPQSPDLVGLGRATPATGSAVAVSRVEVVLLMVAPAGGATVLGISDAPTALSVTA